MDWSGERHFTRVFRAGALDFEVWCTSSSLRDLVDDLFQDLCSSGSLVTPQRIGLIEEVEQGQAMVRLIGASWAGGESDRADVALDLLVGAVNQLALDAEPGLLHLHAGVVARSGNCVIVAAPSGTGKSILTAELVKQGWDYLTDETAALSADGMGITGFHKPMTIKCGGRGLVPEFADLAVAIETSERTSWQVPATRVGRLAPDALEPRLVVLLDRDRAAHPGAPSWTQLEPADAAAVLLQLALDGGRFGTGALAVVAALAQGSLCVRVRVGSMQTTAELVSDLFETPRAGAVGRPQGIENPGAVAVLPGVRVSPTTTTILLEGRAVVHDSATRRVAAFDEHGTEIWLALHDVDHPLGYDIGDVRLTPFVEALQAEGFLVGDREEIQPDDR